MLRRWRVGAIPLAVAAVVAAVVVATAQQAPPDPRTAEQIGVSVDGVPIELVRVGDPKAPRKVLVVGCVHGNECAGRAIVDRLKAWREAPAGVELLLVRNLNPDGFAHDARDNAHGVDLNRNSSEGWSAQVPGAGPRPWSEPESRAIRRLILRDRPEIAVWYHQALDLVDFPESGGGEDLTRSYAALTGMRAQRLAPRPGSLSRWDNAEVEPGSSFVVELPAGKLRPKQVDRQAAAILAISAGD